MPKVHTETGRGSWSLYDEKTEEQEALLATPTPRSPAAYATPFAVGARVALAGVTSATLEGRKGVVRKVFTDGRCGVKICVEINH